VTLNCIHIFIVTGSFFYWCVMKPASQRFFIHSCIYLRILIISYLATFHGTNSLSGRMCRKAVNQSINNKDIIQLIHPSNSYTSSLVSTWMGDHQGKLSAAHLCPFVGVELNLWPTVQNSRYRADTDENQSINQSIQLTCKHGQILTKPGYPERDATNHYFIIILWLHQCQFL